MIRVRIPPPLREATAGEREVSASGATVGEILKDVVGRYPTLEPLILADGEIQPFVNVYLDGEDVRTLSGLETAASKEATLILLPAMAGGR